VAQFVEITSAEDDLLCDYVRLRDGALRRQLEAEHGVFIAEGARIIRRACEAGHTVRSFLLTPAWIDGLRDILDACDAPVYVMTEELAEAVTGFHVHRGALASVLRLPGAEVETLLDVRRLVVCEDLVDHTNVGAIIRCAAGLGWDGVLLSPGAADPLYRRAIKTSMGAVFALPWARLGRGVHDLERLRHAGFTLVATALRDDAIPLEAAAADLTGRRIALLVGTEGDGLSAGWLRAADVVVRIPMARGVDSLNVAAATAIACYVLGPSSDASARPRGDTGQSAG